MPPRRIHPSVLIFACVFAASIGGCSKSTAPKSEAVNDVQPNANARIISQNTLGSEGLRSQIVAVRRADDGSLAFYGLYDGQNGTGVLNASGTLRWFRAISYEPRYVAPLSASASVPHGLIVTGRRDKNGDGNFDEGYAGLYSSAGNLLSQSKVASDTSDISFNAFTAVDDSTFIACGTERRAGVEHPLLVSLHLRAPGSLEVGPTLVVQGQIGRLAGIVVSSSTPIEFTLATTWASGNKRGLSRLRVPWPGFDSIVVDWSHEIVPPFGPWVLISLTLEQSAGNLYVAGIFDDSRKPAGTGFYDSGIAASYTSTGDLRWLAVVSLTAHSEGFNSIHVGADAVYAIGYAGQYGVGSVTEESLGYGLISKLNLEDGHVIANFTIGSDHYQSGLYSAVPTMDGLICTGYTYKEYTYQGDFQAWFATVNVDTTGAVAGRIGGVVPARFTGHPSRRYGDAGGE